MNTENVGNVSSASLSLLRASFWPRFGVVTLRNLARNAIEMDTACTKDDPVREVVDPSKLPSDDRIATAERKADALIAECAELGIQILTYLDSEYPTKLRLIEDAPPIIYVKGNVAALGLPSIAVVGTRDSSKLGSQWARKIGERLSGYGLSVVSGLARGIDAAAHEGALASKGVTVAILAHGLHTVTPAANRELAERILEHGGALVSEHPPGTPPRRPEFVRRNRIQSGVSIASIIVESGIKGGTMHQARFTKEQGRDLLVVLPPSELVAKYSFQSDGGASLVERMGARTLASSDALDEYLEEIAGRGLLGERDAHHASSQLGLL